MLKIATVPSFPAKVKFKTLGANGTQVPMEYTAKFKGMTLSDYRTLLRRCTEAAETGEDGDQKMIDEVLLGWEGVGDENGVPLEFSPQARDALMDVLGCRAATVQTFMASVTGAKQGN